MILNASRRILFIILTLVSGLGFWGGEVWGQIPLTGSTYTQNFNTLANSGLTNVILPDGWAFSESGTNANGTYAADDGTATSGNTYSYGPVSSTERAFGGLLSGSLNPTIGSSIINNTGNVINSLSIEYTGEQWRLGATGRTDRLDFQYSTNATSLTTGTWTDVNTLDFVSPQTSPVGAFNGNLDANRTNIISSITGLTLPENGIIWIRWIDFNASGADDGLAIDDFYITTTSSCNITITNFLPATGPTGTVVDITGSNFTISSTVYFNGILATTTTFISSALLRATVPTGADSGPITVTTTCSSSSSSPFNVINTLCTTPATDLFITEYVEGSSNNKAIEIGNYTGASINLSNYKIDTYFNGSSTAAASSIVTLPNINLANNDIYVVVHGGASQDLKDRSDLLTISSLSWFNGDDAVVLRKGASTKVDIFGNIGCDPGAFWLTTGIQTADRSLVRNNNIANGVTTNPGGCPTDFPTITDWTGYPIDTYSNLGSHDIAYSATPATISTQPSPTSVCTGYSNSISLIASGATSYQWKYFDGSNWINVVDAVGIYSGAQTASLTITGASGLNELQYYCEVYSAPTCFVVSNAAPLKVGDIWIGTSSDWISEANWCTGVKPDQLTDVIIPTSPVGSNMPVIGNSITADCRDIEIQTGATLTIQSDAVSSGSLITNGISTGTGIVTYNRYQEADKWHILSSPLYNAGNQTSLSDANVAKPGGTFNVAVYDELSNEWIYQPALPIPFARGTGYVVKLSTGNTNVGFTGILNTTMLDVVVQSTSGYYGWNSVGNPFTSALKITENTNGFIDANAAVLESSYSAIYLWSADASGYKVISKVGYTPKYGFGSFSDAVVQAGQGFLINVKSPQLGDAEYPNGTIHRTITFNKGTSGMQVHSTNTTLKKSEDSWPGLTLLATNNCRTRSTIVAFNEKMTTGLDPSYDAGLLSVSDFNLHTHLVAGGNETNFTIQCLPDSMYGTLSVPVGIDLPQPGTLTFKVAGVILPEGVYPVIEDRLLQLNTPLKTETDSLTVDIAEATRGTGRFYLHFGGSEINTGINTRPETSELTAHYANQKITISGTPEQGSKAWLYDINGRKLSGEYRLTSENQNEIPVTGLSSGIYLLKIEGKTKRQTLKITILNQ